MKLSVKEFSDKARAAKPEYAHLDDADLIQIVTQRKPEWLSKIDRDDLIKVSNESVTKQISKERQKVFQSMSGVDRFRAGAGYGALDIYQGVKQLFGGDVEEYKGTKAAYLDATKGDKTTAVGEIAGGIAATLPTMLIPGGAVANAISKAKPLVKTAIALGSAGSAGMGYGATEFVDEGETRTKNTLLGGLFGVGSVGAGMLLKKVGSKAFNALKGKYANADVQDLMDLSKKYDIPLSKADVTGKGKNTERALEGVPLVGMGGFRKEGAAKVQSAIKREADNINPAWDDAIQESLARKAKAGKAQARVNYDRVEKLSHGVSVEPKNAIEQAAKHEADIAGSIMGNETNPFSKIRQNLIKKERTFTDLRKDRSDLQKAAVKASTAGDRNLARQLNEVKDGIEADIETLISKKAEKDAVKKGSEMFAEMPYANATGSKAWKEGDSRAISSLTMEKYGSSVDDRAKNAWLDKAEAASKEDLKSAFKTAQDHYKKAVVPYNDRTIVNAIKTDTPDELFEKFIKKGKGDRANNFYNLLDDKGKAAFRDGLIDNAIKGATNPATGEASPAKLAGYLQRMSDPIESTLKGPDLEQVKGLAKIMKHAERYGQVNESPSNGMALIPYLKAGGLAAAGYGGATNPGATAAGVVSGAALTKLTSLMKTKGYKVALASDKIGSPAFEKAIDEIIKQLPRASAVTGKEIQE